MQHGQKLSPLSAKRHLHQTVSDISHVFVFLGWKITERSNSITGPLKKGQVLVSPHLAHNFLFIDCRSAESVIMASHQIPACSFPWGGAQCVPRYRPQNLFHFRLELANGSRHHLVNGTGILWYKSDVQNEGVIFIQEQCQKQLKIRTPFKLYKGPKQSVWQTEKAS